MRPDTVPANFYPRPPRGGRPDQPEQQRVFQHISIHALREEGDHGARTYANSAEQFLSTPSARRATHHRHHGDPGGRISIHALREEGDWAQQSTGCTERYFYPRPPRGGRRAGQSGLMLLSKFLSTPSARRATCSAVQSARRMPISIHALREEGDRVAGFFFCHSANFYPRPPRGGRLLGFKLNDKEDTISIHALREEGDGGNAPIKTYLDKISIHALREEGDSKNRDKISIFKQIIQHSARI